ncbi:MAG: peptidase S41, partial [Bacteroidaceae bacterium]|nr:peptidase S41 [Bacteroidaceae bacterium]
RRNEISALKSASEIEKYLDRNNVLGQFYDFAARNGVKSSHNLSGPALKQMRTSLYGNIIYDSLDMEDYISFFNETDATVQRAVSILSEK